MSRDYLLFVEDIVTACQRISRYTHGLAYDIFVADEQTTDAVLHNLAVIGEAVKQVPDEVRMRYPQIEWRKIAGLRDIVIHHYFGIDYEIVWDVAQNEVPELLLHAQDILVAEDSE